MAKITPDMGLVIPDQTDPAFSWADLLNAVFERIDNHNHDFSASEGLYIDIATIKINDSFSVSNDGYFLNVNNLSFVPNNSNLVLNSFYTDDVDLYFLDGYNNYIRLTKAANINVLLTQGGIHRDYPTTSAVVNYSSTNQKYSWQDSNGNLAYLIANNLFCNNIGTSLDIESLSTTFQNFTITSLSPVTANTLVICDSDNNFDYLTSTYDITSIVKRDASGSITPLQLTSYTITNKITYENGDFAPLSPQETTIPNKLFSWFLTYQVNSITVIPALSQLYTPNGIKISGGYFAPGGTSFFNSGVFSGNVGSFFKNKYQDGDDFLLVFYGSTLAQRYQVYSSNATKNVFPVSISIGGAL